MASSLLLSLACESSLPFASPYIGALRPNLRLASACIEKDSPHCVDVGDRARKLLALWGDPEDDDLAAPWRLENKWFKAAPEGVSGATFAEACAAWSEAHFRNERVEPPWTWHRCEEAVTDASGKRALTTFRVRYAHWAYDITLVLVREGEQWRLRAAADGTIDCMIE